MALSVHISAFIILHIFGPKQPLPIQILFVKSNQADFRPKHALYKITVHIVKLADILDIPKSLPST